MNSSATTLSRAPPQEAIEIARDLATKLLEAQSGTSTAHLLPMREEFDCPLIVAT